ncbi:MAG: hypothetical protein QOJ42_4723 [Acidobacteriaceae bacterium]|nr:hypothetical protein [Acidobacteriaceae bacterium]
MRLQASPLSTPDAQRLCCRPALRRACGNYSEWNHPSVPRKQVGLNQIRRVQRWVVEKIAKRQAGYGVRKRRYGLLHTVAREINPLQEVSDLVSTNAKGNLKHLWVRHFLAHGCVETRAALLDHSKVKGGYIGNRLDMVVAGKVAVGRTVEIGIGSGNRGDPIQRDCLGKGGAQIRVGRAAIANEPAGIDIEVHEKLAWLTSSSVLLAMYWGLSESRFDKAIW